MSNCQHFKAWRFLYLPPGLTFKTGWQPYHHPVPLSCNLGTVTSWNPLSYSRPVMGTTLPLSLHLWVKFFGNTDIFRSVSDWDVMLGWKFNCVSKNRYASVFTNQPKLGPFNETNPHGVTTQKHPKSQLHRSEDLKYPNTGNVYHGT